MADKLTLIPISTWAKDPNSPRGPAEPWDDAAAAYRATPTPEAASNYLSTIKPIISTAIKTYAGGADSPLIQAKAKSIALDAALKHNPSVTKLKTHLLTNLQGLRRYSAKIDAPTKTPEQVAIDKQRINQHFDDLRLELGRDPSDAELADTTGIPISRIAKARGAPSAFAWGTAAEGIELRQPTQQANARKIWAEFIYHDLSPSDKLIMEHTLGMTGKKILSTGELANKLGVTAGAVSQRKARIESMLNEYRDFTGV